MASDLGLGLKPVQDAISAQLVATTRTAGQLAAEDLDFLRTSEPKIGKKLDRQSKAMLGLAGRLIESATAGTNVKDPKIKKVSQIDENWRGIVDVIDNLLERADRSLDEFKGVIRKLSAEKEEAIESASADRRSHKPHKIHHLSKPQLQFRSVPRNDETTAFRPLLKTKPHAKRSLEESLRPVPGESGLEEYKHPYEQEITEATYPASVYIRAEPVPPNDDPEGKTLTWVDTPEQLARMLDDLKQAKAIAIDLEHHDQHSYVGIVCLMQISTREKDWVVDTLKPWREDLQVLNEVFADPNILKVFHGSTMDMIWLQRDLGLYVVGLFDTYHATVALRYPRHGLAYLLKQFENFDAQKQYQMADWRIRPLTPEMLHYARADTHYLLHIYDNLRNELIEKSSGEDSNLINYVLERSKEEALQRYERNFYDVERGVGAAGWLSILLRTPAALNKQQLAVFRAVHQFRDSIARQADESLFAVMRNDTIFAIAREMPEEMAGLMGCINPVSPFVQPKLSELLSTVRKAKREGENGPELSEVMKWPEVLQAREKFDSVYRRGVRKEKEKTPRTASSTFGVAEVLQAERERAEGSDTTPSVAESSVFWGAMLGQDQVNGQISHPVPSISSLRLTIPLPDSKSSSADDTHINPTPSIVETAAPPPATSPPSTFTIKELKQQDRKRKAEESLAKEPAKKATRIESREDVAGDGEDTSSSEDEDEGSSDEDDDDDEKGRGQNEVPPAVSQEVDKNGDTTLESDQIMLDDAEDSLSNQRSQKKGKKKQKGVNQQLQKDECYRSAKALVGAGTGAGHKLARKLIRRMDKGAKPTEEEREKIRKAVKQNGGVGSQKAKTPRSSAPATPQSAAKETPFDYANAPSMLSTPDAGTQSARGKKGSNKKNKTFDPYAKALDTSKGAPKPKHGGGGGRSKTFKG